MSFLQGVAPNKSIMSQWMAPHSGVYGQLKWTQQVIFKKRHEVGRRRGVGVI